LGFATALANLRADVYTVFESMLKNGNPPGDWEALIKHASAMKKTT